MTKSPRRFGRRHLIGAVVIAVLVCGGLGYGVVYRQNQEGKAPTEAADAFLNALQAKSPADAYLRLCSATKKQFSMARFVAYVQAQPQIESHHAKSVTVNTVDGVRSAVVLEDVTSAGGSDLARGIVVDRENGNWLICGQPY